MTSILRRLLFVCALAFAIVVLFNACDEDDVDPTCSGCPAATPWSKPDISNCYSTKSACESAQGGTCQICN